MKYSEYICYLARIPYQLWQLKRIIKEMGGNVVLPGWKGDVKGLLLFTNNVDFKKHPAIARVFTGHGTSNKSSPKIFGDKGKDLFDYYWTSGPKFLQYLEEFGHRTKKKEVKIGNLRFDWFYHGPTSEQVRKTLDIRNSRPIVLIAPTYNMGTFEHCGKILSPLLKKYNVVLKPHPIEKVSSKIQHKRLQIYTGDISDIMYGADILISDESSVAYDFTVTGRPIVLCPPITTSSVDDDEKYDLKCHVPLYRNWQDDDIMEKIEEAYEKRDEIKKLCKRAFYYTDGEASERACDWMMKTIDERWG